MSFEKFETLRNLFCSQYPGVTKGKMMSAPAIHYNGKVFAFLSKEDKMVFRLGKSYSPSNITVPTKPFNPFKNKGPLAGWFEVEATYSGQWEELTAKALQLMKPNDPK
ncbi:hypothetical protein [Spongiimicrobium sp. 3-5]|uniref:hypothetical protein n=1 Tax=Spongiimicrobium sp. 3-5 TaxID=3332596 RepID=UPI00397F876A